MLKYSSFKKVKLNSWSNQSSSCLVYRPERQTDLAKIISEEHTNGLISYGRGLNYGDESFNTPGYVIDTQRLNRLISFDELTGQLVCEPGVSFLDLMIVFAPRGWILPVIPGSIHVTLGGAIANDIHGKNNFKYGSISYHIHELELVTKQKKYILSSQSNPDLFYATIGGLGLTGVISKITLNLVKQNSYLKTYDHKVDNFELLIEQLIQDSKNNDFSAAWVDLSNLRKHRGRGIIYNANFSEDEAQTFKPQSYTIPFAPSISMINKTSIKLFNNYYYHKKAACIYKSKHLIDYINPLDKISNWNILYGKKGLYQVQFVVPFEHAVTTIQEIINLIETSKVYISLAVMKALFKPGLGLLSFPKPGITLALDLVKNDNSKLFINKVFEMILKYEGRVYLAKDSLLNANYFKAMYPNHQEFINICNKYQLSEIFNSDLARRLEIN